jgi:predicted Zn-dependent protease
MKARKRTLLIGLLALSAAVAGCAVNPATGKREFIIISPEQEIAIGNEAAPQFEGEFGGKVPSEKLQQYVREIGRSVSETAERKIAYEFSLLNSDVPNAFALPGGKVYVTAGLMAIMTNERELAAVLGHEVGHVTALHNVKGLQRQLGAELLAQIAADVVGGKGGQAAGAATKIVGGIMALRYSRDDEYQADELGVRYMTKAGYSPWGMVELLTALNELSGSGSGGLPEIFQTHPPSQKRVERAREIIRKEHTGFQAAEPDPHGERFREMRDLLASIRRGQG